MEKIGIIGGSGLYELEGLHKKEEVEVTTPFGNPSDVLLLAEMNGKDVVFLPRHGKKHTINPSHINYRANIYAMKKMGVTRLISVSACGSLKRELKPLDFVIPNQFVDRTNQARSQTFFDDGVVAHIAFSHPVCESLVDTLYNAAKSAGVMVHKGGAYVNMEGPQFSTLAESNLYRSWGMDIIGMTNMVEARLAREAEICYATLAAVTDYDCWYTEEETVTVDVVLSNFRKNVENSKKILKNVFSHLHAQRKCECASALKHAIVTPKEAIPKDTREKLNIIMGKYIK